MTDAIIKVDPQDDLKFQCMKAEMTTLRDRAIALIVNSDGGMIAASTDLGIIADLKKSIETLRKEYVKPLNDHVSGINLIFKEVSEPINEVDKIIRGKVLAYQAEQNRLRAEAEEINRLRMEAAKREMELKGELTEPVNLVEVTEEAPSRVTTEQGEVGTRNVRKWEVSSLAEVPIEYLMIDSTKVGKVVRAGIPSIPGIRIWEEATLTVKSHGVGTRGQFMEVEELPF